MNFAQFVSFYFSNLWIIDGFKRISRSTVGDGTKYTVTGEFELKPGMTIKDAADFIHDRLNKFQYDGNARIEDAIGRIRYKGRYINDLYTDERSVSMRASPKKYDFSWIVWSMSFFSSKTNDGNEDYYTTNDAAMTIRIVDKKQTPEGVVFRIRIVGQMIISTLCRDSVYSEGVRF